MVFEMIFAAGPSLKYPARFCKTHHSIPLWGDVWKLFPWDAAVIRLRHGNFKAI
jgi:hypothetical protein